MYSNVITTYVQQCIVLNFLKLFMQFLFKKYLWRMIKPYQQLNQSYC